MKFSTTIKEVGKSVNELFETTGSYIIFSDVADEMLKEICLIHDGIELESEIVSGDILNFDDNSYTIIKVGEEANSTIKSLGHCTFVFGKDESYENLPGQIVLKEPCTSGEVGVGARISVK